MEIYEQLEDSIYQTLRECLDYLGHTAPIIFSHGNGNEPDSAYVIVNVLNVEQTGKADRGLLVRNGLHQDVSQYTSLVQVSVLGEGAGVLALSLKNALMNNIVCYEVCRKNNLSIIRRSGIRRVPQKREAKWVEMFNFDIDLYFSVFSEYEVDYVEAVTVNGFPIDKH